LAFAFNNGSELKNTGGADVVLCAPEPSILSMRLRTPAQRQRCHRLMAPAGYYRHKAEECERLARETDDPQQARLYRALLLDFSKKAAAAEIVEQRSHVGRMQE
jgi:hypothetical protein